MKKLVVVLVITVGVYNYGYYVGKRISIIKLQDDIASRYFVNIGRPKTQKEQCIFDKIIYNDNKECN